MLLLLLQFSPEQIIVGELDTWLRFSLDLELSSQLLVLPKTDELDWQPKASAKVRYQAHLLTISSPTQAQHDSRRAGQHSAPASPTPLRCLPRDKWPAVVPLLLGSLRPGDLRLVWGEVREVEPSAPEARPLTPLPTTALT